MSEDEASEHFVGVYFATEGVDAHLEGWGLLNLKVGEVIDASGCGEFDGHCDEADEQAVFAYGPDAEALFAAMEPVVRAFPARPARVVLRFGDIDDETVVEREFYL